MIASAQLALGCMENVATFSPCRNWRYALHRQWGSGEGVAFLMFNPSTADERQDDPTIRKCRGFAQRWGYGRMVIVNLFAIRGTDPRIVQRVSDPIGPLNDYHIREAVQSCEALICAWGCSGHFGSKYQNRPIDLLESLKPWDFGVVAQCLGYSAGGAPRHPLMLSYTTPRETFQLK